jgi:hypothetical protein
MTARLGGLDDDVWMGFGTVDQGIERLAAKRPIRSRQVDDDCAGAGPSLFHHQVRTG